MPIITAWAVAICGLFFMALTFRVIAVRRSSGVAMGDGDDALLQRRMRGQANAAEQMPLTLLALGCAELLGGWPWLIALLAAVFTTGRLAHGYGFGWLEHTPKLRVYGMVASVTGSFGIFGTLLVLVILRSVSG